MNIIEFFKERVIFLIINILILSFTGILLEALKVDLYAIIFIVVINFIGIIVFHIYEYIKKKKYYDEVLSNLKSLDKKYLISEMMDEADFLDGKILYSIIKETDKSMNDEILKLKLNIREYKEYIELWVHEVKTPIATCKLLIENNDFPVTESIGEEVERVENYIEQALFYARSNTLEKDYIIKEIKIIDCINSSVKKNLNQLIENKIKIDITDRDNIVYSDSKWVEFILNQIISNSIKYRKKDNSILKFYSEKSGENIVLTIEDNGIGMDEKDVLKAFDKGYTGTNGRKFTKSTGIGLYLCNKLCIKLGLKIKLESLLNGGTKVYIFFPINKMMLFE